MNMAFSFIEFIDLLQQHQIGLPIFTILGLLFGSFATMASYRIPRGEDLVIKPSHCPVCSHKLGIPDLFPVFSWLVSFGKCRHCHAKVSARYPLTELVMAILFAAIYLKVGVTVASLCLMGLAVCLVILSIIDLETLFIPNIILITILLLGIIYRYILGSEISGYVFSILLGFSVAIAFKGVLHICGKEFNIGYIKLLVIFGFFLGIQHIIPFLLLAIISAITLILLRAKILHKEGAPFVPALSLSLLACLIFL